MKTKTSLFFILLWSLCSTVAQAQINFGGLAEFELRKGGADSDPTVNQTPNDEWFVYSPSVRIFVNGRISDQWFVSGALQSDYYRGQRSEIFFSSFNINWLASESLKITAGRFITPFGRYDELLLSSQNPFVHMPLSHVWNMPVDRKQGYVFSGTSYDGIAGQSLVYRRLYSQGLMLSGVNERETLEYQLAATLTSVSSYTDVGEQDRPALTGRLVMQPVIWNKIGISFSNGPYLIDDPINDVLQDERRAKYHQTIVTAYTEFSYHYYQLLLQYTFNRWDSPWIDSQGELVEDNIQNDVTHYLAKLKVRFPFWVGGYGAVRFERYLPHDITLNSRDITGQPTPDKDRFEFVIGYKVKRNITLKTSYLLSRNDGLELEDDVFAIQLSAGF
ncbi:hypothetical protein NC796_20580 [Aliifodinibius sp. S!AR15-10]|uniref:hypothetical protein n=1 Tax=Aliifodinibius sp. S!AR15-10 TaxID=2950437 RepID=UPI0028621E00|nr:hypothetical protein [Aliifodinibius sp. S!AR15-10]MDR8393561.1 hypothetical protein [Aliifodinibius sp. S!AR15-10]